MSNTGEKMTKEEAIAGIRKPLPVKAGNNVPGIDAYLDRLDELFGQEWKQDVQATASGVRCEITIRHAGGFYINRTAIAKTTEAAFKLCCRMIGMGRSSSTNP